MLCLPTGQLDKKRIFVKVILIKNKVSHTHDGQIKALWNLPRMIISFRVCETLYPVQPGKVLVISEDNLSKEPQASHWAIFFPSVPITQEKWLWLLEDSTIGLLQKQEQYVFWSNQSCYQPGTIWRDFLATLFLHCARKQHRNCTVVNSTRISRQTTSILQ